MSDVNRYKIYPAIGDVSAELNGDGEWVKYDDFNALALRLQACEKELADTRRALAAYAQDRWGGGTKAVDSLLSIHPLVSGAPKP